MKQIMLISILILPVYGMSQLTIDEQSKIDSLKTVIEVSMDESEKVKALVAWDDLIYWFDIDLDLSLNHQIDSICSIQLSHDLSSQIRFFYLKQKGDANNKLGIIYGNKGDHDLSLTHYESAYECFKKIHDKSGMAKTLNNSGNTYNLKGDNASAIQKFMLALKIKEEMGDINGIGATYGSIGITYLDQGLLDQAELYLQKSLEFYKKGGNSRGIAGALINSAIIYADQAKIALELGDEKLATELFDQALSNNQEAIEICTKIGENLFLTNAMNNIGIIKVRKEKFDEAIYYYEKALKVYNANGDQGGIASTCINIGTAYFRLKDYKKSVSLLLEGYKISKEIGSIILLRDAAYSLFQLYDETSNYQDALEMYEEYILMRDSVSSEKNQKEIIRQEYKYEYEKQAAVDSIQNMQIEKVKDAEIAAQNAQIGQEKTQRYMLFGGLIFVLSFLFFVFNRLKITRKQKKIIETQKELVEEAHQEITDSIAYAKRIQSAILPPSNRIKEYLTDSFVVYKPKDMVAGDFYWMNKVGDNVIFAAADCTGHGVPGAMVSVVCNNALNRSVREYKLSDPGKILNKTREIVISEFNSFKHSNEKSTTDVKDGMDIALCALNGRKLKYAGAHNPLWIIRGNEILETKANKQPIGKFDNAEPFITHDINLEVGDIIYIFSDGFVDQFGGEKGKKFKPKALRELLLTVQDKSMEEQKYIIDAAFEKWKGDFEQVDDVCMIGVRI